MPWFDCIEAFASRHRGPQYTFLDSITELVLTKDPNAKTPNKKLTHQSPKS
jgi:hypothetical protein